MQAVVGRRKRQTQHHQAQNTYLGRFIDIEDAARAYDEAAKKYFGDFANLNFP